MRTASAARLAIFAFVTLLQTCPVVAVARDAPESAATHRFRLSGAGEPVVVFESGLGQGKRTWAPVFNAVAELTRAVAYDRAGYGQSERSAASRDGLQIVLELRYMLRTENLAPPYVLVGHSLGGTMVKLFAKTFPDEVCGVVLVDARHEELPSAVASMA